MATKFSASALRILFSTLFFLAFSTTTISQDLSFSDAFGEPDDEFLPVEQAFSVIPELNGETLTMTWQITDAYYLYRHRLYLQIRSESRAENIAFSIPDGKKKFDEIFQEELEVYYGGVTMTAAIPAWTEPYEIILGSQGCADAGLCYPPREQFFSLIDKQLTEIDKAQFGSTPIEVSKDAKAQEEFQAPKQGLLLIVLGAIAGGMILNLMPCVFPVLSLKALTLATGNPNKHRINGWAYTAGVLASFGLVAVVIVLAKSAGTSLGWGFQLQEPSFVAALIYLFFLLGLNLFGVFEIGTSWMGIGSKLAAGDGISASFFTGVLAAVVASPCTAPFMATAIGATLTQGPLVTFAVFISIGLGMALPYLLLSHSPAISAKLPKPGAWMETFKQFLAFPLLLTCAWLLTVLGAQTSADASAVLVAGTVLLAMGLWAWKHQPSSEWKWLVKTFATALIIISAYIALNIKDYDGKSAEIWQEYQPELIEQLRTDNTAVFIDLTADWCITCKINERVALNQNEVQEFARANDIAMVKGDWTSADPVITQLLRQYGRNGVPLYLMYPTDSNADAEILPQILTPQIVIEAMGKALSQ